MRSFDVSMWSERYADERPLGLRKYQLPPTSSDASKQVCSMPLSRSALHDTRPLTPAPTTHTRISAGGYAGASRASSGPLREKAHTTLDLAGPGTREILSTRLSRPL